MWTFPLHSLVFVVEHLATPHARNSPCGIFKYIITTMVAKKVKAKKGIKGPKKLMKVPRPMAIAPVDKAVRDYISLLKNPCGGPLVGPVGATSSGYITRFETTHVINPTSPFWTVKWTPGMVSTTAANTRGLLGVESATIGGALTTVLTDDEAPGFTFLSNTCQTYRCLAACIQVRYMDTEVDRKGIIGSTMTTGARGFNTIQETYSLSVDRARTPDDTLEVLWQPVDGDEDFTDVTANQPDASQPRKAAILLSGNNCKANSIALRFVVVYQWTPGSNDNIIQSVPVPGTGMTMSAIVKIAQQTGFVAGRLLRGYIGGGLGGVARELGAMTLVGRKNMGQ